MLDNLLKKENLLILAAVVCVAIYFNQKTVKESQSAQNLVNALPIIGGLAFGLNTLVQVIK
jgi:flagellar biogenesis protein FliO